MRLPPQRRGLLAMFDGPDGVGKTTTIKEVAAQLQEQGKKVHVTRVHGGTQIGEVLRTVSLSDLPRRPLTDLLLSQTMHAELAAELREKRKQGIWCLVDRSPLSMWSYQVKGSGLDEKRALPIIKSDLREFEPDLVFVYTAGLETLKHRLAQRGGSKKDYFESQPDGFHERVIAGYEDTARRFGAILIAAEADSAEIAEQTMRHIRQFTAQHRLA